VYTMFIIEVFLLIETLILWLDVRHCLVK
jgi:hypothetical protein